MKKISIITPCYNAENYIAETIQSVIHQKPVLDGSLELEYVICDGHSTDKTIEIAESTLKQAPPACTYKLLSEPDSGMYDALAKGLNLVSGEAIAYLNAGDFYHPSAFSVVSEIFTHQLANWIAGYTICYNERSQVIEATLPYRYRQSFFEWGAYGNGLPHVQQESTFWTARLAEQIDLKALANFKYVGDFYLWQQFAKVEPLKIVRSYLGGFKYHAGQLSQETQNNASAYQTELQTITRKPTLSEQAIAKLDRLLWSAPYKVKQKLAGDRFISYSRELNTWQLDNQ